MDGVPADGRNAEGDGGEIKMAKLRKMLGDINQPEIVRLMRMIETQSKETLAKWAVDCAEERYLAIYEEQAFGKIYTQDMGDLEKGRYPYYAILEVRDCLIGQKKTAELKAKLAAAAEAAKEAEGFPAAQAAARAVATACAAIRTPTNALGFVFYGAAAAAYDQAGADQPQEVYDALATEEFRSLIESLEKVMIPDEKKPAKINWNCQDRKTAAGKEEMK